MRSFACSLAFVSVLIFPYSMLAQRQIFTINPDASAVHIMLGSPSHGIRGTFHLEAGTIAFDQTASTVSGFVVVAAESGKTGNRRRDKTISNEILDASEFANILFIPKSYQGTINRSGDSSIQLAGVITLHGTSHDLTVPVQLHIDGAMCMAESKFIVPYVMWGLKRFRFFIFKAPKEVAVDLIFRGSCQLRPL
jgi:polyisoprenoid-binding protein YceI